MTNTTLVRNQGVYFVSEKFYGMRGGRVRSFNYSFDRLDSIEVETDGDHARHIVYMDQLVDPREYNKALFA